MNRPDPRAEETQLEFYPLRLPRWPALLRLRRRDPLVRPADRIEAVVAALATVMVVIATPLAAAVGTEVHANHRLAYTEQSQDRHTVPATVVETPGTADNPRLNTTTVTVSWSLDGVQHTGTTRAPADVEPGDTVDIWVDDHGAQVPPPTPTIHAAYEAVGGALLILAGVATLAAIVVGVTRAVCDRIRSAGWQHDLDTLIGDGRGHPTNRP